MKVLVQLRLLENQFATAVSPPTPEEEAEGARRLYAAGIVEQIWHRADKAGACLLLNVTDVEAARTALQSLPFIAANLLEIEFITPLKPYGGFCPRAEV